MNILALDLSLTSTGWAAHYPGTPGEWLPWSASGTLDPGSRRGYDRLDWIRGAVLELAARGPGADLVVIEGYAFGSPRQSYSREIAELGGIIRMALRDLGYRWVDVPPASLKKYAAGKGNAGKELVLVEAVKRLGYGGSSNDEADALWLLEMALDHYGLTEPRVPKAQREALAKVEWPSISPVETATVAVGGRR